MPSKIRNAALLSALHEKSAGGDIMVVDSLTIAHPKSKEIQALLDNLKIQESVVIVMDAQDNNIQLASRNLPWGKIAFAKQINAMDILGAKKLVIARDALTALETRLAGLVKK
ncbi:MAG: 50S ribosomal protein L4 [Omnitrophica WOR_2 bacterium GWA2_44_7]|nr:MAG: 50S ribosomal protein L4 [Omnitrophica WOR_2 bacterium GWA2_44_7]